jgi:hypothetical protein
MPKRKTDPQTGEPVLTYRENRFVDGYIAGGGNATRAAVEAGYSTNCANRAAYKVLSRPDVQERIQQRIAQAKASPDEALGSLVSQMRADVTDCFGPDGAFSVQLARQNGLGHLLKVSTTIHRKLLENGAFQTTGDSTKIEFLSPQSAAAQLLKRSSRRDPGQHADTAISFAETQQMLERLIARTMEEFPSMSRQDVIDEIAQLRPDVIKYIVPEPHAEATAND